MLRSFVFVAPSARADPAGVRTIIPQPHSICQEEIYTILRLFSIPILVKLPIAFSNDFCYTKTIKGKGNKTMTTLYISENVRFIGSAETALKIQRTMTAEQNRIRREREDRLAVERARADWERTGDSRDWSYYSDLHKDVYGFRPTWER